MRQSFHGSAYSPYACKLFLTRSRPQACSERHVRPVVWSLTSPRVEPSTFDAHGKLGCDLSELRGQWRRVLQLPDREQLQLYRQLRDYLAIGPGDPEAADAEMEARAVSLEAMQRATEHLRLPPGEAPTVEQYQSAHRALDLPMSSQQVIRRWGFWRTAVIAFEGGRTVRTAEQRSLQRATAGRARTHEEYIAGVRRWLDRQPASSTDADYDEFVSTVNRSRGEDVAPLVKAPTLRRTLGLGWEDILRVAQGKLDIEQAREQARERRGDSDLVATAEVARILDINGATMSQQAEQPGFPAPVAVIARGRVWLRTDIEAHRDGRPVPHRAPGELQDRLLDTNTVSEMVTFAPDTLRAAVHRQHWHRVPEPSGKVGQTLYWYRESVEAWVREHRELVKKRVRQRSAGRHLSAL